MDATDNHNDARHKNGDSIELEEVGTANELAGAPTQADQQSEEGTDRPELESDMLVDQLDQPEGLNATSVPGHDAESDSISVPSVPSLPQSSTEPTGTNDIASGDGKRIDLKNSATDAVYDAAPDIAAVTEQGANADSNDCSGDVGKDEIPIGEQQQQSIPIDNAHTTNSFTNNSSNELIMHSPSQHHELTPALLTNIAESLGDINIDTFGVPGVDDGAQDPSSIANIMEDTSMNNQDYGTNNDAECLEDDDDAQSTLSSSFVNVELASVPVSGSDTVDIHNGIENEEATPHDRYHASTNDAKATEYCTYSGSHTEINSSNNNDIPPSNQKHCQLHPSNNQHGSQQSPFEQQLPSQQSLQPQTKQQPPKTKKNLHHPLLTPLAKLPWDKFMNVGNACDLLFNCKYTMRQVEDEVREENMIMDHYVVDYEAGKAGRDEDYLTKNACGNLAYAEEEDEEGCGENDFVEMGLECCSMLDVDDEDEEDVEEGGNHQQKLIQSQYDHQQQARECSDHNAIANESGYTEEEHDRGCEIDGDNGGIKEEMTSLLPKNAESQNMLDDRHEQLVAGAKMCGNSDKDQAYADLLSKEQKAEKNWKISNPSLDMMLYRQFYDD